MYQETGNGQHVKHLYASQMCTLAGELLHLPLLMSPPPRALGIEDFVKRCADAYLTMIRQLHTRASAKGGKLALGLTGGKDSVGILAAAHKAKVPLVCFTLDHNKKDLRKAKVRAKILGYPHRKVSISKNEKYAKRWDQRVGDECRDQDRAILRTGALGFLPPGSIMIMGNGPEWIGGPVQDMSALAKQVLSDRKASSWRNWVAAHTEIIPIDVRAFFEGVEGVWLRNNQRPYTLDVHPGIRRCSWPMSRELFHLSFLLPEGKRNKAWVQDKILLELCPILSDN